MKIFAIFFLLVLGGLGYWYIQNGEEKELQSAGGNRGGFGGAPLVVVEPIKREQIIDTIEAIGTTVANESVTLTAKVTDTVSRIHFNDGDYVEAGHILVELTNNEQSALLSEAQANLNDALTQLRRLEELNAKKLVPNSEVDQANAKTDAARGRLKAITARLDDRLIRAPFKGLLGFRQVSQGTLLTNNTSITTLDDISVLKLDFSIPEIHMDTIHAGQKILAKSGAWPDRQFEGEIRTLSSRVNPVTRAVTVRAVIPNEDRVLRPGMLLTINIITNERTSIIVHESAVTQVAAETFVYIAGADGRVSKQLVDIGVRRFGYYEVIGGLSVGDQIVTQGAFKLRDGASFKIKEASQQKNGSRNKRSREFAKTAAVPSNSG